MSMTSDMNSPFKAFEAMSAAPNDAVRKGMEQVMSFAGEFGDLSREGFQAASDSARATAKGVKEINDCAQSYVQNAYAAGIEAGRSMGAAKSVKEAMDIQADFTKDAVNTYFEKVSEMMSLAAGAMREGFEPFNSHARHVVEKFQSVE